MNIRNNFIKICDSEYKCVICGKTTSKYGIKGHMWRCHSEQGKQFKPSKGKHSWNNGLTKETDIRVFKNSESIKKAYIVKPGTFKGKKHSNETKLKMSESKKKLYEEGWECICGRCKKISYNSKNCGLIKVDGNWEFAVAIYLDSINVDWIRNKSRFKYIKPDGKEATYCPDFYVYEWDSYIEVKGYKTELDEYKWKQFPFKLLIWNHSVLLQKDILDKLGNISKRLSMDG